MKVGTEQDWQAARKGLLAAERELEEHAKRMEAWREKRAPGAVETARAQMAAMAQQAAPKK